VYGTEGDHAATISAAEQWDTTADALIALAEAVAVGS